MNLYKWIVACAVILGAVVGGVYSLRNMLASKKTDPQAAEVAEAAERKATRDVWVWRRNGASGFVEMPYVGEDVSGFGYSEMWNERAADNIFIGYKSEE